MASSRRRPISGATSSGTVVRRSPTTRQIRIGAAFPLTLTASRASVAKRSRTERHVSSPITSPSRGATACIRLAVFTTSPATASPTCGPSPNATTASPVFTATRTATSGSASLSARIEAEEVEGRPHRALGVVLVGHRCAEDPHRRVSDELVQRAAVALDRVLRAFVERHERATYVLGIGFVRSRREPHEVGEQDRDEASFLDR